MRLFYLALAFLIFLVIGCLPVEEEIFEGIQIDLGDPQTIKIFTYQDMQQRDSLMAYFKHANPTYRYLAANAFSSYQDSNAIPGLAKLLEDPIDKVKSAAAYALGQNGSQQAEQYLIDGFRQYDSLSVNTGSNGAILEAIGKTGGQDMLKALATVRTYTLKDTALLEGQMRGIYRFALRGMTIEEGTTTAVNYLTEKPYPQSVRVIAANYLFRANDLNYKPFVSRLIQQFESDPDPRIRMCIAVALGKSGQTPALESLRRQFESEPDYRVRCNILRGLTYFDYKRVQDVVFNALNDKNLHVSRTAAQYFIDHGISLDAQQYRTISRSLKQPLVKALMYSATNKHLPDYFSITKGNLNNELEVFYKQIKDPYLKGYYLKAMANVPGNYERIRSLGFSADTSIIRTMAVESIAQIALDPTLAQKFGRRGLLRLRQELFNILSEAIQSKDAAMIAIAAQTIANPEAGLQNPAREQSEIFEEALAGLNLPAEIETYTALKDCIAALDGQEYVSNPPEYNNPIPWQLLQGYGDTIQAECITDKGLINLELYPLLAPGTVANFIRLAQDRYYHGKTIHRVVPNFVIQGGCPRGDGYGSLDYSIRSELAPAYYDDEGYIGMASAGNHTECTQWFITHSPTPHLDGKYSIFGKVVQGMDVVNNIQMGDVIKEINILN